MKAFQKNDERLDAACFQYREDEMAAAICGTRTNNIDTHRLKSDTYKAVPDEDASKKRHMQFNHW